MLINETVDSSSFNGSKWCGVYADGQSMISAGPFSSVLGLFRETALVEDFSFSLSRERCSQI